MCGPLSVVAQIQVLLVDPEPRAALRVGPCVLSARLPGLTVLSSFPVKADRAESPCVDAALDTLGTAGVSHAPTIAARLPTSPPAPNTLLTRGSR